MNGIAQIIAPPVIALAGTKLVPVLGHKVMDIFQFSGRRTMERDLEMLAKFEKAMPTRPSRTPGLFELHSSLVERAQEHSYRNLELQQRLMMLLIVFGMPFYGLVMGIPVVAGLPEGWRPAAGSAWLVLIVLISIGFLDSSAKYSTRQRRLLDKKREHFLKTGEYPKPGEVELDPEPHGWLVKSSLWLWRNTRKAARWTLSPFRAIWTQSQRLRGRAGETTTTQIPAGQSQAEVAVLELVPPSQDPQEPAAS